MGGERLNQTQKDKLHSLQRSAILSITGAYSSTSNRKLLDLLGLLEINEEIPLRRQTKDLGSSERKKMRKELIAERRREGEAYGFECRLEESVGREIFFFLTGHGPFVSHYRRYDNELPTNCRFCGVFEESAEHLLLHCSAFGDLEMSRETEMTAIESKCGYIVKRISKL